MASADVFDVFDVFSELRLNIGTSDIKLWGCR